MGAYELKAGPAQVHTMGHTTNTVFLPLTPPIAGIRAQEGRTAFRFENDSGDIEIRIVCEESNDGVTWSNRVNVSTWSSTDGWTYGSSYSTLPAKSWIRFGVIARNLTGSDIHSASVSLLLDLRFD